MYADNVFASSKVTLNARAADHEARTSAPIAAKVLTSKPTRASGTFTPLFDADVSMLKPASVLLVFQVLNRFWSMKKPLFDPGQGRIIEKSGCSRKTVERALQALEQNRPCNRNCGSLHPLILVRERGRSHNASIEPFSCDMVPTPRKPRTERQTPSIEKAKAIPLPFEIVRQNDASSNEPLVRQNDAPSEDMVRQNVAAFNGTKKPILETHAETHADAADEYRGERAEAHATLRSMGIHVSQIARLITLYGAGTCINQARCLPYRKAYEKSDNRPGLLISAIRSNWEQPPKALVASTRAAAEADNLRRKEANKKVDQAEESAYVHRITMIAIRAFRCEISEEDAIQEIHRRSFHPDPRMAQIERTIASRQLSVALARIDSMGLDGA